MSRRISRADALDASSALTEEQSDHSDEKRYPKRQTSSKELMSLQNQGVQGSPAYATRSRTKVDIDFKNLGDPLTPRKSRRSLATLPSKPRALDVNDRSSSPVSNSTKTTDSSDKMGAVMQKQATEKVESNVMKNKSLVGRILKSKSNNSSIDRDYADNEFSESENEEDHDKSFDAEHLLPKSSLSSAHMSEESPEKKDDSGQQDSESESDTIIKLARPASKKTRCRMISESSSEDEDNHKERSEPNFKLRLDDSDKEEQVEQNETSDDEGWTNASPFLDSAALCVSDEEETEENSEEEPSEIVELAERELKKNEMIPAEASDESCQESKEEIDSQAKLQTQLNKEDKCTSDDSMMTEEFIDDENLSPVHIFSPLKTTDQNIARPDSAASVRSNIKEMMTCRVELEKMSEEFVENSAKSPVGSLKPSVTSPSPNDAIKRAQDNKSHQELKSPELNEENTSNDDSVVPSLAVVDQGVGSPKTSKSGDPAQKPLSPKKSSQDLQPRNQEETVVTPKTSPAKSTEHGNGSPNITAKILENQSKSLSPDKSFQSVGSENLGEEIIISSNSPQQSAETNLRSPIRTAALTENKLKTPSPVKSLFISPDRSYQRVTPEKTRESPKKTPESITTSSDLTEMSSIPSQPMTEKNSTPVKTPMVNKTQMNLIDSETQTTPKKAVAECPPESPGIYEIKVERLSRTPESPREMPSLLISPSKSPVLSLQTKSPQKDSVVHKSPGKVSINASPVTSNKNKSPDKTKKDTSPLSATRNVGKYVSPLKNNGNMHSKTSSLPRKVTNLLIEESNNEKLFSSEEEDEVPAQESKDDDNDDIKSSPEVDGDRYDDGNARDNEESDAESPIEKFTEQLMGARNKHVPAKKSIMSDKGKQKETKEEMTNKKQEAKKSTVKPTSNNGDEVYLSDSDDDGQFYEKIRRLFEERMQEISDTSSDKISVKKSSKKKPSGTENRPESQKTKKKKHKKRDGERKGKADLVDKFSENKQPLLNHGNNSSKKNMSKKSKFIVSEDTTHAVEQTSNISSSKKRKLKDSSSPENRRKIAKLSFMGTSTDDVDSFADTVKESPKMSKARSMKVYKMRQANLERQLKAMMNWEVTSLPVGVNAGGDKKTSKDKHAATDVEVSSKSAKNPRSSKHEISETVVPDESALSKSAKRKRKKKAKRMELELQLQTKQQESSKATNIAEIPYEDNDSDAPEEISFNESKISAFAALRDASHSIKHEQEKKKAKQRAKQERIRAEKEQKLSKKPEPVPSTSAKPATSDSEVTEPAKKKKKKKDKSLKASDTEKEPSLLPVSVLEQLSKQPQVTEPVKKHKSHRKRSLHESDHDQSQLSTKSPINGEPKSKKMYIPVRSSGPTQFQLAPLDIVPAAAASSLQQTAVWRDTMLYGKRIKRHTVEEVRAIKDKLKFKKKDRL